MKKGLLFVIIAGVTWGTSCIFANIFAPYGFSSLQITALRLLFAFLSMLLYCAVFKREAIKLRLRDMPFVLVCGISLVGTASFYYESMRLTSPSTSVMLMYIAPVPVMLLSVWFLGEHFNVKKGIAVVLMLVGCALVAGVIGDFKPDVLGVLMGVLSAASYTCYNIFCKISARKGIDPFSASLYTYLFGSILALVLCRSWEIPSLLAQAPLFLTPTFVLHGILTCLIPYLFYTMSLKYISVGVASAMSIIEPMTGAILGIILYNDPLTVFSAVGMLLVVASVFLLGMGEATPKDKKATCKQKT